MHTSLIGLLLLSPVSGWRQWHYKTEDAADAFPDWQSMWGYDTGPRGRRGHTMVLFGTKVSEAEGGNWSADPSP